MRILLGAASVMILTLAACSSESPPPEQPASEQTSAVAPARQAVAALRTADGTDAGTVTATEGPDGIRLALNVIGLDAGERGVHVHTTGLCEGPDFASAGSHWNPTDKQHGLDAPGGHHAGDMPNLVIEQGGAGTLEYTLQGATFDGLIDTDGSAFVVHAGRDDQITDPSGDSGDRVVCGVFEQVPAA